MAVQEVLADDLFYILFIDIRVPDPLGVHDHARTFLAPVQAPGRVDPDTPLPGQAEVLHQGFGVGAHLSGVVVLAAGGAVIPFVGTEEDVAAVVAHPISVRAAPEPGKELRSERISKRDRGESIGSLGANSR